MHPTPFDDRTLTLRGAPQQLADVATLLGSTTRLRALTALMAAGEPLNINEVARRVGVDASPVRTHLELLEKAGLVTEVRGRPGRARYFTTALRDVRVTLEGVHGDAPATASAAAADAAAGNEVPKGVEKLQKRLDALEAQVEKRMEKARQLRRELAAAWATATR